MMNKETLDMWNTGILKDELVKTTTHFFCGAVLYECERIDTEIGVEAGYYALKDRLTYYSRTHSSYGVRPISHATNLLEIFFNQKKEIPAYVYFWLWKYYSRELDNIVNIDTYPFRHYDTYNELQRIYIQQYRNWKYNEKDDIKYFKKTRRRICKMFRFGDYADIFKMCNTSFLDNVSKQEIDNIADLMVNLFPKEISNCPDDEHAAAIGYIIGKYGAAKLHA